MSRRHLSAQRTWHLGLCQESLFSRVCAANLFSVRLDCYQSCVACFSVPPLCDDAPAPCHRLCLTQHVITAILTMINRSCVANLAISQRRWRVHCSRKTPSHTLSCFRIASRTRLCFEKPLKILAALLLQRNTCALCWPWRPATIRTLKTKLTVSWRRLATSSRT